MTLRLKNGRLWSQTAWVLTLLPTPPARRPSAGCLTPRCIGPLDIGWGREQHHLIGMLSGVTEIIMCKPLRTVTGLLPFLPEQVLYSVAQLSLPWRFEICMLLLLHEFLKLAKDIPASVPMTECPCIVCCVGLAT